MGTTTRHRIRSVASALLAAALVVATLAVVDAATPAGATVPPVVDPNTSQVTADALPTAQINGVVWDQEIVGNTVYAVGEFSRARPAGSNPGVNEVTRNNILAYNITTGVMTNFAPNVNGTIKSVTSSPDRTRIYIAGSFTAVNGSNRYRIASFNVSDGSLNSFAPVVDYRVNDIVATNSTVYVGGAFNWAYNTNSRPRLAAFNASNGALLNWAPAADAEVRALILSPDGTKLFVAGSFLNITTVPNYGFAAVDSVTGAVLPWPANSVIRLSRTNSSILSLKTDGTSIFGAGYAFSRADGNIEGTWSVNPDTGAVNWVEDCHGDSYDQEPMNGTLYVASHSHYCANSGGFPQTEVWADNMKHALAWTLDARGTVKREPWSYFNWEGYPAPSMVNWFPELAIGSYTGQNQAAWDVEGNGQYLVMGGEFPSVNGTNQQGLVRFAVRPIAPADQGPRLGGPAFPLNVSSKSAGQVRVVFPANWDRDSATLTYRLLRNNVVVDTRVVKSTFWDRPTIGFTQTGLTPGVSYNFRVQAVDSDGNQQQSDISPITVTGSGPPTPYADAVMNDGATIHWRMDESSAGTTPDAVAFDPGTINTGASIGAAGTGAILNEPNGAAANLTNVSTSQIYDPISYPSTDPISIEAWVKTASTTGGRIVGQSQRTTTSSNQQDRVLFMMPNGRIEFGLRQVNAGPGPNSPNTRFLLESPAGFNDNQWHHLVGTVGPNGSHLYVDGVRVASRGDVMTGVAYYPFLRVGADSLAGWNGVRPTTDNLTGSVDEVATYPSVLTAAQIANHYRQSGRTPALTPTPGDAYGAAVQNGGPYLYYRLAEPSGTVAADSSISNNTGDYVGTVTRSQPGAIGGNAAARFGSGLVASRTQLYNPSNYSVEAWINTTTTSGGSIVGFGNNRTTTSTTNDRQVYMRNDGTLAFRVANGGQVVSSASFNDGQWHHVVATQGPNGIALYVDGAVVGTAAQVLGGAYFGYWKIGNDNTAGGSSSNAFAGSIDEVAVYERVLSSAEVLNHLGLGGGVVANVPPTAGFTTVVDHLDVDFTSTSTDIDGTIQSWLWAFGDGNTSTVENPSHHYDTGDTYNVSLTVTDDDGDSKTIVQPVTVTPPPANVPPVAVFSFTTQGLTVNTTSTSTDTDGQVTTWAWDFSDGFTPSGSAATHTFAAPGTYTVSLTVTDDDGATNSTSTPITVSDTIVYATDAFERTVVGGFGTTAPGGAWTLSGGNTNFAVNGGQGRITVPTAGASRAATLASVSALNVDARVDMTVDKAPTGSGLLYGVVVRKVGTTEYRARLKARPTSNQLEIMRVVNGVEASIVTVNVPGVVVAGTVAHFRMTATGSGTTALAAKVWFDGQSEPAAWQAQTTDSTAGLQGPGGVGVHIYVFGSATNAPVVASIDNLDARSI